MAIGGEEMTGEEMGEKMTVRAKTTQSTLRISVALLMLPFLASCGSDDDCWNCTVAVSNGLVAADFSGSGADSVVATSTVLQYAQLNPGNLEIYLARAPGGFAAPVLAPAGDDPLFLAAADLNADRLPDVVSASYDDQQISVYMNQPQSPGTFAAPLLLSSPGVSQLAVGDMNGDGLPDIVSADYGVSLFLQTAPGTFASAVDLYPNGANWVAVGDLNGDGVPDVALTDFSGVKVLMHVGPASEVAYAAPVSVFTQTANANVAGANLIAIADVNGDGFNDLVITDPGPTGCGAPTVSVLLQDAANPGHFLPAVAYPRGGCNPAESIVVKDVNDDGHPDIVVGGVNGVTVLLQNAASPGAFLTATAYSAPDANEIAVADVNGDGYPDIVVPTGPPQPIVNGVQGNVPGMLLQNSGSLGTFGPLQQLP
jgi:hypothetical protein